MHSGVEDVRLRIASRLWHCSGCPMHTSASLSTSVLFFTMLYTCVLRMTGNTSTFCTSKGGRGYSRPRWLQTGAGGNSFYPVLMQ